MKQINHEARPGGPTMAALSVTRLTQHAPVFRLELLFFSCSPTPPGTSPVGGKPSLSSSKVVTHCADITRPAPEDGREQTRLGGLWLDRPVLERLAVDCEPSPPFMILLIQRHAPFIKMWEVTYYFFSYQDMLLQSRSRQSNIRGGL
jgi:hypothetical protein